MLKDWINIFKSNTVAVASSNMQQVHHSKPKGNSHYPEGNKLPFNEHQSQHAMNICCIGGGYVVCDSFLSDKSNVLCREVPSALS